MDLSVIVIIIILTSLIISGFTYIAVRDGQEKEHRQISDQKDKDKLGMKKLARKMPFLRNYYTGTNYLRIKDNEGYGDFFKNLKISDIEQIPSYYRFDVLWDLIVYKKIPNWFDNEKLAQPYQMISCTENTYSYINNDGVSCLYSDY